MPFLSEHVTVTKDSNSRKAIILRMYHPHTFSKLTQYPLKKPVKRVSSFISFPDHRKNKRKTDGVMTVEAAAAVPFFLCFFINILSLILFFHVFITNLESLHQQGRQLVMLAASAEDITELSGEMIELVKPVLVRPPVSLLGYRGTLIVSSCYMRAWTGYDVEREAVSGNPKESWVYLTENASVYHTRESCTHLSLSIEMVSKAQISSLRNEDGGKYTPCEKCGGEGSSMVYVAREGDHYHNTIVCSGLKRTVRRVPISEVMEVPACGRCG